MGTKDKKASEDGQAQGAPAKAWLLGVAAWVLPGAGHLLQKRWGRALLLGGAVWSMFITGLLFGGHLFSLLGGDPNTTLLLRVAPAIANLGAGGLYLVSWLGDLFFAELPDQMRRATYEYGNTFLLVAGLLNYLAMLDAFDIAAGRKS